MDEESFAKALELLKIKMEEQGYNMSFEIARRLFGITFITQAIGRGYIKRVVTKATGQRIVMKRALNDDNNK